MFGGETHCWFADNQPGVCTNITGCVYCTTAKLSDPDSACYNEQEGWCQGHENMPGATDIAQDAIECVDIKLKQVCNCGPFPNCKWNNSAASQGVYCMDGVKTDDQRTACQPPAQFCDDTNSKFNQTVCNQLAESYFMPCEWDNTTTPAQCKFETGMLFKEGPGGFNDIGSESSCFAAGGQWKVVTFTDPSGMVKTDSWCEMGSGNGFEQCDDSCWACEFQPDGSAWANIAAAQAACNASAAGFCKWTTDLSAFNGYGWCDFPTNFNFGGGNCDTNCQDCNFANNPSQECVQSSAGCQWTGTNCMSLSKKTCGTECFSCYSQAECTASAAQCTWNTNPTFCKPIGMTGSNEICFDGMDNDNDNKIDCSDPDCGFDTFCGGSFLMSGSGGGGSGVGGGGTDCKMRGMNQTYCQAGSTPMGNCTWVSTPWNETFCDFPGASCWMSGENQTVCEASTGCNWINFTQEGDQPMCDVIKAECFIPNQTLCNQAVGCAWTTDPYSPIGGFCDVAVFAQCKQLHDLSACAANTNCTWQTDQFSMEGGFCNPICFNLDSASCENATYSPMCELIETGCEPEFSMGGCPEYDDNETACALNNATCYWTPMGVGGLCDGKGMQMMFQGMDPSPPHHLGDDDLDAALPEEVDIRYFGLKDDPDILGFGMGVTSMRNAAACNGYQVQGAGTGTGHNTTKFYWYLDTDGNQNGGCNASDTGGVHDDGFEFLLKYTTTWQNGQAVDVKNLYKCSGGTWVLTNVPMNSNKMMMCMEINGAMVAVDKESLESFTTAYNKSQPMRVLVASATDSTNMTSPSDSAEEGWYTSGSVDFKFECCECPGQDMDGDGFNSEMDPDCKFVKKFGFVPFEDCTDNKDNNGDGTVDCNDPQCTFNPVCGGTFSFTSNANDKTAPKITFSKVDAFIDGAFVKFDTNEPANGTVEFYRRNSTCNNINKTLIDVGDPLVTFDDYKPFHNAPIDNFQGNPQKLGYNLQNGTSYYYKLKVCDPSGNCAVSACSNFTTETTAKNFVFKMGLPPGFKMNIPAWGLQNDNMTYGQQTNASSAKDINITVKCPDEGYQMTLVGVDLLKAKDLDFSSAFTCDASEDLIGMNSTKWQSLLYELSVDYVLITWATTGDIIYHCDDDGENCEDVTDYAECTSTANGTTCKIPVTLGFSTYTVGTSSSPPPSGGGGGGGGATAKTLAADLTTPGTTLSMTLTKGQKFTLVYDGTQHNYKVESVTAAVVTIKSLETFEEKYLFTSVPRGFDFDNDGTDDVRLRVDGVTAGKALVSMTSISTPERPNLLPIAAPKPKEKEEAEAPPQPAPAEATQAIPQEVQPQPQPPQPSPIQGMAALEQPKAPFSLSGIGQTEMIAGIVLVAILGACVAMIWLPGRKKE
jgi:hypothetical protein